MMANLIHLHHRVTPVHLHHQGGRNKGRLPEFLRDNNVRNHHRHPRRFVAARLWPTCRRRAHPHPAGARRDRDHSSASEGPPGSLAMTTCAKAYFTRAGSNTPRGILHFGFDETEAPAMPKAWSEDGSLGPLLLSDWKQSDLGEFQVDQEEVQRAMSIATKQCKEFNEVWTSSRQSR